jgi:hypothetical protein
MKPAPDPAERPPRQLRSYIAPAAPATRAPATGSEAVLRVETGFTPRWFHRHCGIDFSEKWHRDPRRRGESVLRMRRELNRRFPGIGIGKREAEIPPANLDGVHGALVMALLFGLPAQYYADNWPAAGHRYLSDAECASLAVPDIESAPVIRQLFEQMDIIEKDYGRVEGYINWQGVLNTAFRLRGQAIFTDLLTAPGRARHLFEVIARTMIAGMRLLYTRQRESGVEVYHATVSNCVVNMLHPDHYEEFLLPWDRMIAAAFAAFGIHNCAWNADPYMEAYAAIPSLGYVDMGLDTDLRRARDRCPHARRAIMYPPQDLRNKSMPAIRDDLQRVRDELSPCDIVLADIDAGTPDERVSAFHAIVRELTA